MMLDVQHVLCAPQMQLSTNGISVDLQLKLCYLPNNQLSGTLPSSWSLMDQVGKDDLLH